MPSPYYTDDRVTVHHGDCLDVLRTLPDCSVDSVVTDPPYDLTAGKQGGTGAASVDLTTPYGRARITAGNSGGFMGKAWDATGVAFDPATWQECLRVLKPGGHMLAFGGTRTWHRLACAIEDAGFEIRDTVASLGGGGSAGLLWMHGQGFPKSLDVSKAIDKAAGAERKVIGPRIRVDGKSPGRDGGMRLGRDEEAGYLPAVVTAPATEDAARWEGFGTALKPAFEPIVVARKPLTGTVAANVVAYGTGALNIAATRVETDDNLNGGAYSLGGRGGDLPGAARTAVEAGMFAEGGGRRPGEYRQPQGRWPSNVVLTHRGYAVYALKHDVPDEVAEAILAYYGTEQELRAMRDGGSGDAVGTGEASVLLSGMREPCAQGRPEDRVGEGHLRELQGNVRNDPSMGEGRAPEILLADLSGPGEPGEQQPAGEGSLPRVPGQDGDQPGDWRAVEPVEGREVHFQGVRPHPGADVPGGGAETHRADGHEERVHLGASGGCCGDGGPCPDEGRRGPSRQRREDGQPAGEPAGYSTGGSLDRAPGDRAEVPHTPGRGRDVARRERNLTVPAESVPRGWLRYFEPAGDSPTCTEDVCAPGCPVAELDRQAPEVGNNGQSRYNAADKFPGVYGDFTTEERPGRPRDKGAASRFFPIFRYQAKAPTRERPKVDGVAHPTCKPLALMCWLIRLVTPPGGVVLDPFAGSGTTAEAAILEGFRCVTIEREAEYLPLILARIQRQEPVEAPPARPEQLALLDDDPAA